MTLSTIDKLTAAGWMVLLQQALERRCQITDPASRTRWREYVRVVLIKIRASRKRLEPPPGARLHQSVGKALATAGFVSNLVLGAGHDDA